MFRNTKTNLNSVSENPTINSSYFLPIKTENHVNDRVPCLILFWLLTPKHIVLIFWNSQETIWEFYLYFKISLSLPSEILFRIKTRKFLLAINTKKLISSLKNTSFPLKLSAIIIIFPVLLPIPQ